MKRLFWYWSVFIAFSGATLIGQAQTVIYEDGFDTDTSDMYEVYLLDRPDGGIDSEVQFNFDFADSVNGLGEPIPPAPSSTDGNTTGLWMSANMTQGLKSLAGVYTNEEFSGDYQVFVDYYAKVNLDGVGTTNQILVGINHSGDKVVTYQQGNFGLPEDLNDSDGYYWGAAPDIGWGSFDYGLLEGIPGVEDGPDDTACATWFIEEPVQDCFIPGDGENEDGSPRPYNSLFEVIYFNNTPGLVGGSANAWTTLRMDYIGGVVSVYLKSTIMDDLEIALADFPWLQVTEDGFVKVAEYDDPDDTYTSGKIYLAYEDPFDSLFSETQFGIFDNLQVVQIGTEVDGWNLY